MGRIVILGDNQFASGDSVSRFFFFFLCADPCVWGHWVLRTFLWVLVIVFWGTEQSFIIIIFFFSTPLFLLFKDFVPPRRAYGPMMGDTPWGRRRQTTSIGWHWSVEEDWHVFDSCWGEPQSVCFGDSIGPFFRGGEMGVPVSVFGGSGVFLGQFICGGDNLFFFLIQC